MNSLNRGHNSFSDGLVMDVVSNVQEPGFDDRISTAYCCSLEYLGVSKNRGLTEEVRSRRSHDSLARPQAGRVLELVPPLFVIWKDGSHLLLPLRHP